jgi:Na+-transporting NADH:ubiquinone oxidoreductase subunit B
MRPLRAFLDRVGRHFHEGGKLQELYPLYEVIDTFFYTSGEVTRGRCHVRDAMDLKRVMSTVLVALIPCVVMAMVNTGLQANTAMETVAGVSEAPGWRGAVLGILGVGYDPGSLWDNLLHGAVYFIPVYVVCMVVGIAWEVLFAVVRKHEVNEGFFVTGLLFPLTLPATIPLWQVAVGITFGVVVGKEVFGGTGRNFLNPALTARAFLFFAYPAQISGDAVWTAVDGFTGATALSLAGDGGTSALASQGITWSQAFLGTIQGSMGETSTLACLIGAVILVASGIGSWRIMLSMLIGAMGLAALLYGIGSTTNPWFTLGPGWHLVLGGFAFGLVFMATDPVSAAMTNVGQYIYGALIGVLVIVIRVFNPGFPEGTMLAILFGNVFAPLIDYYVVRANIRRRALRYA